MENNEHNAPRKNPRYRSLDGFVRPNQGHGLNLENRWHTAPVVKPASRPAASPQPSTIQEPTEQVIGGGAPEPPKNLPTLNIESSSKKRKRNPKFKSRHMKQRRIAAGIIIVILVILLAGGGWIGWKFFHNISKIFGGSFGSNLSSLLNSSPVKGENVGRVNILLAGDSADDPNHAGAQLTDSIMIVSIDTKGNNSFMLSVPRDLWVTLPDGSHQKINAANEQTNFSESGYPSGGMGALEKVVTEQLGVPIDYYALIDYSAFRDAVNAVGGITINIQSTDPRGLFDPNISRADGGPLKLPNGNDNLNGQTALDLARARGDPCYCGQYAYGFPNSDFDRTQHQRQMLVALEQKATSIGVASNPIKIGQLFDALGNNVKTDLTLENIKRLTQLTKGISPSKITSTSYPYGGSSPIIGGALEYGQDALVPTAGPTDFSQLQLFYQKLISTNPAVKEGAKVVVLNGTNSSGVAKTEENKLISKGIDVVGIADASKNYPTTTIIDNSKGKMPATLSLLKSVYGNTVTTSQLEVSGYNPDFIVIIGGSAN
jgi:LCP family protein required for cell wall assembly